MKKSGKKNASCNAHNVSTHKPPFACGRKQSLGWMPDGETDPIIYLCRCLDHGASDAVEEDKPDPVTPLAELTAKHHFAGKRLTWLFNAFCNQLDFESGNGSFGERNTDELLSAFCDFMQWRGVPYLEARHGDNVQIRDALQSICTSIKVETVKCAPMLDGSDGGEAPQLALAVTPDEFGQRLTGLLDLDAAPQQPTAQAADGDEIARKVADAVGGQFKDIAANYPKPRKDKGGKHVTRPKRKSEYGKTAKAVADDFNKSRFVPERGAKPMGGCTETQIKQWDLEYPDAEHPHPRWGYYADLRLRADLKNEYGEVLQNWARY